jgi:hypothetical protein
MHAAATLCNAFRALKNLIAVPFAGLGTEDIVLDEIKVVDFPFAHDDLLAPVQKGPDTSILMQRGWLNTFS